MATIKIIAGPVEFAGKEIPIPMNVRQSESIFMEMAKSKCFWETDLLGLTRSEAYDMKIMDFSARCVRSIGNGIPVFVDGQRIICLSISRKSVDNALRKVINLLQVSEGDMRIVKDDNEALKIEMITNIENDCFAEDLIFANA